MKLLVECLVLSVVMLNVLSVEGVCPVGYQGENVNPWGRCQGTYPQCPANSYCYPYRQQYNGIYYTPICCPQTINYPQTQSNGNNGVMVPPSNNLFQSRSTVSAIQEQIRTYPLIIYGKSTCIYCKKAKELLSYNYPQYKYHYLDFDLQPGGTWMSEAAQAVSGMKTVPQIWICQQLVGGSVIVIAVMFVFPCACVAFVKTTMSRLHTCLLQSTTVTMVTQS